ncbi:MAG: porin family protein [Betaproteobacteria bacterium]|nr:porin family protein [Betaproteobacteria bacterium]MDH5349719.1 porin family protein [Betaproteobacteria bacterium]
MKTIAVAVLMVTASAFAGAAMAQQQRTYFGGNIVWADYSASGGPSANPTMLSGRFGSEFNRYFAAEGRLGLGIDDDTGVDVDHFFGVYARGILPLADIFSIYGLIGLTAGKVSTSRPGGGSGSDTDVSFGFGADLAISRNLAINFEWAKLFEGSGYEVEATSLGLVYRY